MLEFRRDFVEVTPPGLTIRANGTATARIRALRAGIQTYYENGEKIKELRTVESVRRVAPFFDRIVIVLNHPQDLVQPQNVEELAKGYGKQGWYQDGWIYDDIVMHGKDAIAAAQSSHRQFSAAYFVTRIDQSGEWMDDEGVMGEPGLTYSYDRIAEYKIPHELFSDANERDIFNHLALVRSARAGQDATFVQSNLQSDAIDIRLNTDEASFTDITYEVTDMEEKDMMSVDMGGKTMSMHKDMGSYMKDMMKGIHDMLESSGYDGDMQEAKLDGSTYKMPKSVSDMAKKMKEYMKKKEEKAEDETHRADSLEREKGKLETRNAELESQITQDSSEDKVGEKARSLIQTYHAGIPYFEKDSQPQIDDAISNPTEFMRNAIKARFSVMDEEQAKQSGWSESAIAQWDADTVTSEFNEMLRFLPPREQRVPHTQKFQEWNTPKNQDKEEVTAPALNNLPQYRQAN